MGVEEPWMGDGGQVGKDIPLFSRRQQPCTRPCRCLLHWRRAGGIRGTSMTGVERAAKPSVFAVASAQYSQSMCPCA